MSLHGSRGTIEARRALYDESRALATGNWNGGFGQVEVDAGIAVNSVPRWCDLAHRGAHAAVSADGSARNELNGVSRRGEKQLENSETFRSLLCQIGGDLRGESPAPMIFCEKRQKVNSLFNIL